MPLRGLRQLLGGGGAATQYRPPNTISADERIRREREEGVRTANTNLGIGSGAVIGPGGQLTRTKVGQTADGADVYDTSYQLSDPLQRRFDSESTLQQTLLGAATGAVGDLTGAEAGSVARDRALGILEGRDDRAFAAQRERLAASLAARGIRPGSEAYREAMRSQAIGEAEARDQSFLTAGDVALQEANIGNTVADRYRSNLSTILGGVSPVSTPSVSTLAGLAPSASVTGPNVGAAVADENAQRVENARAAHEAELAKQRERGSLFGGALGLASALPGPIGVGASLLGGLSDNQDSRNRAKNVLTNIFKRS